jgi:hypothetical protein
LYKCDPEISSLDYDTINSSLQLTCFFKQKLAPEEVMWTFKHGGLERVINDFDGGVLSPFRHEFVNHESEDYHSVSRLTVYLINSSYYTNYTVLNTRDSCKINLHIHLIQTGNVVTSAQKNNTSSRSKSLT